MPTFGASIATFHSHDQAMVAAEKLYEIAGRRGVVSVLLADHEAGVLKLSVLPDNRGLSSVAIGGAALGVIGFVGLMALGAGWVLSLIALAWGVALAAMLPAWLTGSTSIARRLRGLDARRCYEMLAGTDRAVVVVVARVERQHAIEAVIAANHGSLMEDVSPWLTTATQPPTSVTDELQRGAH